MTAIRYSRQLTLDQWGAAGQQAMADATVLLVGLGGLGNPAAAYLAGAGIGTLLLNDFDSVDETNLPRQPLFSEQDLGAQKTAAAAAALRRINPGCRVEILDERLSPHRLGETVARSDVVLDGSDNFRTRFAVNQACFDRRVPLVSGAVIRYEAQLAVFLPGRPDQPCYRCLHEGAVESMGDCAGQGVLAPLAGLIGCAMALEALRLVVGFGDSMAGSMLVHDAMSGAWRRLRIARNASCPVCSAPG